VGRNETFCRPLTVAARQRRSPRIFDAHDQIYLAMRYFRRHWRRLYAIAATVERHTRFDGLAQKYLQPAVSAIH
jgi:hypothetical protein